MQKIAVMGFGIVGSGTVELFYKNREAICRRLGTDIDIKYILDLRTFPGSPYEEKITNDFTVIENDPEITVAAELMGGTVPAYDYTERLLSKGISVVTSNKELVARFGAKLLKTAREHGCNYFFEASVGGAIPIIRPLHECLAADKVLRIEGILNGTTNFILTRILDDGMAFDEALALAQSLGYAEKDPAADISGADACRKICILAALSFGRHVYPEWVFTEGIEKIGPVDAAYAAKYGAKIKLIASARVLTPDESDTEAGKLFITVEPQFVCEGNQISHVSDVFNAVSVFAEAAGELMFFGRGAGKLPTASAVLGDVISAATSTDTVLTQSWTDSESPDFIADKSLVKRSFYLRTTDGKTAVEAFPEAEIFEDADEKGETALIVSGLTEKAIRERIKNIEIMIPIKE